jgi:hypothetical protein
MFIGTRFQDHIVAWRKSAGRFAERTHKPPAKSDANYLSPSFPRGNLA